MKMEWSTHREICASKRPPPPPGNDVLYRWQQRYLPMIINICGLLAGLRASQTRETQHIILSRIAFEIDLTPKSLQQQPKTYRDLRAIKITKIDENNPTYRQQMTTIAQYREEEHEYVTHPTHDTLHGFLITRYTPSGSVADICNTTEHGFAFNTITKKTGPPEACGVGYPPTVTSDILQKTLNAHVADYET